jgi:hypothetical protein
MTNKDCLKILLCSYGYDRNIKIEIYRGDSGEVGYDVYAENKEGDIYNECDCEGLMFHIYEILDYMRQNEVRCPSTWWNYSTKDVLNDQGRESIIANLDRKEKELQESLIKMRPAFEWHASNNPCHACKINKHDHWDSIHYNCELSHTHSCEILIKFNEERKQEVT